MQHLELTGKKLWLPSAVEGIKMFTKIPYLLMVLLKAEGKTWTYLWNIRRSSSLKSEQKYYSDCKVSKLACKTD